MRTSQTLEYSVNKAHTSYRMSNVLNEQFYQTVHAMQGVV